jgi:GT2 family glycosyltransferase
MTTSMHKPLSTAASLAASPNLLVTVVVVTHRSAGTVGRCLDAAASALARVEGLGKLLVVLDAASDEVRAQVAASPARVFETPHNVGFAGGAMVGVEAARGEWVLLLNDDVFLEPDAVARMLRAGSSALDIGAVAPQIRFERARNLINSAGLAVDALGVASERLVGAPVTTAEEPREVFGASGAAALYRLQMLREVGGFDERFFAYYEDADLAWRARMRGWRCVYEPTAIAYHFHSATLGHESPRKYYLVGRNRIRMLAKNATGTHLLRVGPAILAYELAYVVFVALTSQTLAPLRGRVRGVLEWRTFRLGGAAERRAVVLDEGGGIRRALARRRAYRAQRPLKRAAAENHRGNRLGDDSEIAS